MAVMLQVPIRTDPDGTIRIGETRILLEVIIGFYNQGESPKKLAEAFPTLTLEQVYAVIAYYLNNRDEVDNYIRRVKEESERLFQKMEAEHPEILALKERLKRSRPS